MACAGPSSVAGTFFASSPAEDGLSRQLDASEILVIAPSSSSHQEIAAHHQADGYAESSSGKARPRNFSLPLGQSGHMVRFYFLEYENDLLLIYELSDERLGWGYLVC